MLEPTNEQVSNLDDLECLLLAKAYVEDCYIKVGEPVFLWEEWVNPNDDTTAYTVSSAGLPSDMDEYYEWYEVVDYEITGQEVTERTIAGKPLIITIKATLTINKGYGDDEDEAPPYTEDCEIFCHMEFDTDMKKWYVESAEQ